MQKVIFQRYGDVEESEEEEYIYEGNYMEEQERVELVELGKKSVVISGAVHG